MIRQECFTEALIEGAREIFETMMFMNIQECRQPDERIRGHTLMGSITFKGNIEGCLTIRCNLDCARAIATNMMAMDDGNELSEEDIYDAIGEVSNMIMGAVKTRIMDTVGDLQVSILSVVSGTDFRKMLD